MLPPPPPLLVGVGGGGGVAPGPVDTTSATAEPAATFVPAAGFWLITLPEGTVPLECCETVPTASAAPVIDVVAAACVRFTTFGTATGPVDTTSATAEVAATLVPAAGFWLITLPAGTVVLDCCETVPSASPAPAIAVVAAASVRLTTFGTITGPGVGAGPDDTTRFTAEPAATPVPDAGF